MPADQPRRGLEYVKPLPPDEGGRARFEVLCDCGTLIVLTIGAAPEGGHLGTAEAAFTCDGCGTTNWFTITVRKADA